MSSLSFSRRSNPTVDRISDLPDPILCNILSLFPTKFATSTSILSKRWRSLYLSLFTLHFDDRTFPNFHTFVIAVHSIMHSRDPTIRLQSFHFKSRHCNLFYQHSINRFVNYAIQSGIHNLKLTLSHSVNLPRIVLDCKTLTILKLKMLTVDVLPSAVDFPLLKTLVLDDVIFRYHGVLINLLSGCPTLEDLHSQRLDVMEYSDSLLHLGQFSEGKVPSLPNLIRANVSNLHIPFKLLYKAQSLRLVLKDTYFPHDFGFDNLTNLELVFASKKIFAHLKWKWLAELLNYCPKLQNLTLLEVCKFEHNSYDDWTNLENVPECLSSQLKTFLFEDYKGTDCELQFAKYIIENSNVLHTMTIQSADCICPFMKPDLFEKLSLCRRGSARCELVFY